MRNNNLRLRLFTLLALGVSLVVTSTKLHAQTGCSPSLGLPFTDLGTMPSAFCQAVAEAYFSGLISGTSATTYSPDDFVSRAQMAAFTTRTLDQSLRRGSRRAALNQWWTPGSVAGLELSPTPTNPGPRGVACDGPDIWAVTGTSGNASLMRVRGSDGKVLQVIDDDDFSLASNPLIAMGRVFVGAFHSCPTGELVMFDPRNSSPFASPQTVAELGGGQVESLAFDGTKIWAASHAFSCGGNAVSYVTVGGAPPWATTIVTTGFSEPYGILYDGSHIWMTDRGDNRLKKINKANGAVLQSILVGTDPGHPVFDGMNIWVPNYGSDNITVVRVKDAVGNPLASCFVLKTLTAPFMLGPLTAAFDGERVAVACQTQGIFVFKSADLSFITGLSTGPDTNPYGACSDGLNFFVTLNGTNKLVRF